MNKHIFVYIFLALFFIVGCLAFFILGVELGLSSSADKYEKSIIPALSVLGSWFGALATSAAVIISLWLAFKQLNQDREILDCRIDMTIIPGVQKTACIGLTIVSKGNKPANIQSITWRGEGTKKSMWVAEFNTNSEKLPKVLSYGEQLHLMHTPGFEVYLAEYVNEYMDGKFENLYLYLNTTTASKRVSISKSVLTTIRNSPKPEAS